MDLQKHLRYLELKNFTTVPFQPGTSASWQATFLPAETQISLVGTTPGIVLRLSYLGITVSHTATGYNLNVEMEALVNLYNAQPGAQVGLVTYVNGAPSYIRVLPSANGNTDLPPLTYEVVQIFTGDAAAFDLECRTRFLPVRLLQVKYNAGVFNPAALYHSQDFYVSRSGKITDRSIHLKAFLNSYELKNSLPYFDMYDFSEAEGEYKLIAPTIPAVLPSDKVYLHYVQY